MKNITHKNEVLRGEVMDEKILNNDYVEPLLDETFLRTIIVRTATFEDKEICLKHMKFLFQRSILNIGVQ